MNCPTCGYAMKPNELFCRACADLKYFRESIRACLRYVADVQTGKIFLRMARRATSARFHIRIIAYPTRSFCGEKLRMQMEYQRNQVPYHAIEEMACEKCVQVWRDLERQFKEALG